MKLFLSLFGPVVFLLLIAPLEGVFGQARLYNVDIPENEATVVFNKRFRLLHLNVKMHDNNQLIWAFRIPDTFWSGDPNTFSPTTLIAGNEFRSIRFQVNVDLSNTWRVPLFFFVPPSGDITVKGEKDYYKLITSSQIGRQPKLENHDLTAVLEREESKANFYRLTIKSDEADIWVERALELHDFLQGGHIEQVHVSQPAPDTIQRELPITGHFDSHQGRQPMKVSVANDGKKLTLERLICGYVFNNELYR